MATTNSSLDQMDFVTVVSVGSDADESSKNPSHQQASAETSNGYVTVLTIGESKRLPDEVEEEVLVYRLPGERLGFGLKFEGGTKAAEFVKRLFIQSCAPDSPASRVHCSWGKLLEGDEVLQIDQQPITSMTRIDCVRCLKDSNVVIKLLIRHFNKNETGGSSSSSSTEDLPLVVSAEKKRTLPPPPPVPPRKVPRKLVKEKPIIVNKNEAPSVVSVSEVNWEREMPKSRFQSPRNSGRIHRQSPDVSRRTFRDFTLSDGSPGPPDAEVYIDLFSQEACSNLSESDDTGSSISTVIDRSGSLPTTSNSSFAGSMPSTPTSIQRHLDVSNVLNPFDDDSDLVPVDDYFSKFVSHRGRGNDELDSSSYLNQESALGEKCIKSVVTVASEDGALQPPANFQDAPLSYGDEDVDVVEAPIKNAMRDDKDENGNCVKSLDKSFKSRKSRAPPPPPPNNSAVENCSENCENKCNLPRLVDFVPKSNKNSPGPENSLNADDTLATISYVKMFLENEIRKANELLMNEQLMIYRAHNSEYEIPNDIYNDDVYNYSWSPSSHLATIGEDDEEGVHEYSFQRSTGTAPIVIVENVDFSEKETELHQIPESKGTGHASREDGSCHDENAVDVALSQSLDVCETMDSPPSCSRQPPDGDEFPYYHETAGATKCALEESSEEPSLQPTTVINPGASSKEQTAFWKLNLFHGNQQSSSNVRDKITIFSTSENNLTKMYRSTDDILFSVEDQEDDRQSSNESKTDTSLPSSILSKENMPRFRLHARSQSLIDISSNTEQPLKKDRWSILAEQRQKNLSRLKGLVIPEKVVENEVIPSGVDIPEINSKSDSSEAIADDKMLKPHISSCSLPWNTSPPPSLPKYSPVFKRKSLELYTLKDPVAHAVSTFTSTFELVPSAKLDLSEKKSENCEKMPASTDAPKSLESITSPTRSDCSFEYINNTCDIKMAQKQQYVESRSRIPSIQSGKSEDDSDNDSAVSSSQSSYISRTSPPPSPSSFAARPDSDAIHFRATPKYDHTNHRLLKAQSVEARNRQNILASAKCRSGKDLKIGSPLIQRKFDDEATGTEKLAKSSPEDCIDESISESQTEDTVPFEEVSNHDTVDSVKASNFKINGATNVVVQNQQNGRITETKSLYLKNVQKYDVSRKGATNPLSKDSRTASVTDLRKSFEKLSQNGPVNANENLPSAKKSVTTSRAPNNNSLVLKKVSAIKKDQPAKPYTSLDVQERQRIVEETVTNLDESICKDDVDVVILRPLIPGGSVGITLAGGSDYETKEITVHKIREDSPAHKDGKLRKGTHVLAINNKTVKGLTHKQIVAILKEPREHVTIVASKRRQAETRPVVDGTSFKRSNSSSSVTQQESVDEVKTTHEEKTVFSVGLDKDAGGLGFSLEGGHDSIEGDVPLLIKKVFKGGAAEKCGSLKVRDEILAVNDMDVTSMSRFEVWTIMKKLPENTAISLTIRR